MPQNLSLNGTLEERLRLELCDLLQANNELRAENSRLKAIIKEENTAKYKAWTRIGELNKQINKKD